MALLATKMGYEGLKVYVGAAGATATNLWWQVTDANCNFTPKEGSQTSRGDSSSPPEEYMAVTGMQREATVKVLDGGDGDPCLAIVGDALDHGLPFALKLADADGNTVWDSDVIGPKKKDAPLDKEGNIELTLKPTLSGGRAGVFAP